MNNNFNNFNNMDDLFNQLMGGMRGYSSENRRYLINGREVTPEEFAHFAHKNLNALNMCKNLFVIQNIEAKNIPTCKNHGRT